ncbi:MAG: hypothetical protein IT328_00435 [Caldilineaceae bacterium]|nr:hypothetical protein [Caldilineaceae bacterium]
MESSTSDLLARLRSVIAQLGNDGGLISPSVYDTAQILRLHPPREGVEPGLEWLLTEQRQDGGWGEPGVPAARDIPTLAAVLALHTYRDKFEVNERIQAGLDFLKGQAHQWESLHIDLIPIAGEMILPHLLDEAAQAGLEIDQAPYARIFELKRTKLNYLARQPISPNSAATYSWEALDHPHMAEALNAHTGVGHSPAATAAWLRTAQQIGEDERLCAQAEAYLARAAATTETGIPGVMPMVYPITGFELAYGLYALLLTGLLDHPALQDVVMPKIEELDDMVVREQGLSFGENFVADVDGTAVAVAVLRAANKPVDVELVRRFWRDNHFYTYVHELNPSVFSNAHALHALVFCDERCQLTEDFLIQRQTKSGAWMIDKWHTSWRSSTLEVVAALLPLGYEDQLYEAGRALVKNQNPDGSWGLANGAPMLESAYSLIALQMLSSIPHIASMTMPALDRGWRWMWEQRDNLASLERIWLGKEVYSALLVDEAYRLCAILSPMLHAIRPRVSKPIMAPALMANVYEESV